MRRLLIRPGGIGDCVLCFPAMEWLRADYTEVWVPGPVVPLVRFADRVRSIQSTGLDLMGLPGVEPPASLRESLRQFDEVVSWYGTNRDEFRMTASELGSQWRFLPALPEPGDGRHAADFFAVQVGAPTPAIPRIAIDPVEPGRIWIHPLSGGAKKNWPYERFEQLAERLAGLAPVRWGETADGSRAFESLDQLAARLAGARLYVGNDSGITHLAASVGAPVVSIFGPTEPVLWGPRGRSVRIVRTADLGSLSVEEVLAACRELLD